MRSSPWDPYENLPLDYATLFKLENYTSMMKSVYEANDVRKAKVDINDPYIAPGTWSAAVWIA